MTKEKQRMEAVEKQLLSDIRELTSRLFVYEDGWCGMVPFDGELTELQTGPPVTFAELTWREQADVLRSFIRWDRYPERAWDDEYRVRDNIAGGKPPEQWLEGTSLRQSFQQLAEGKTPPPLMQHPEVTQDDLARLLDVLNVTGADGPPLTPNATIAFEDLLNGLQDQRDSQQKSPNEQAANEAQLAKDRGIKR
jgi:hypothetical protein